MLFSIFKTWIFHHFVWSFFLKQTFLPFSIGQTVVLGPLLWTHVNCAQISPLIFWSVESFYSCIKTLGVLQRNFEFLCLLFIVFLAFLWCHLSLLSGGVCLIGYNRVKSNLWGPFCFFFSPWFLKSCGCWLDEVLVFLVIFGWTIKLEGSSVNYWRPVRY